MTLATTTPRWVVPFAAGRRSDRRLLGGKGANLAEMTHLGLPVPPGFIVTTDACRSFLESGGLPTGLEEEVRAGLRELEDVMDQRLGDPRAPLLLSVRSGAPFSMPGMMDTVLDLGASRATVPGLAARGGGRFAWDATRRFIEMFGRVVLGVDERHFAARLHAAVQRAGVTDERGLDEHQLADVVARYEQVLVDADRPLPADPYAQLFAAITAVFRSWNGARARAYRRLEGIPDDLGTAVTVQVMVFGNLGPDSGSGVAFTRNPATGDPEPYGDFLLEAQGEDVVAGGRAPRPLAELADTLPDAYRELLAHLRTLERHERDLCDVEFTIEAGRLWLLQTRVGKRSAAAAVRLAVDYVGEGLIDPAEAVRRVAPEQVDRLLHPRFATAVTPLTTGLAASPGAASGRIVLTSPEAKRRAAAGETVILVRPETSPDDLEGMVAAAGLLTSRGGLVSHAAVVARGLGRPAVCGATEVEVDLEDGTVTIAGLVLPEGEVISIDGSSGAIVLGEVALETPDRDERLEQLLEWADQHATLEVHANADTPDDARRARDAGAVGIGLCRTEHQFLGERLPLIQRVILADDPDDEAAALAVLERQQRDDFEALLEVMDGLPVVVRLLDPPLHEFLPDVDELLVRDATETLGEADRRLLATALRLREHNPMLGIRGVRLGIVRPAIYRAQIRALLAAVAARRDAGGNPRLEIMLPLPATDAEVAWGVELIANVATELGLDAPYAVATMIETPRAALIAGRIAPQVQTFSFGTNDLTQLTFGFSRDDVEAGYLPAALPLGLLSSDPFAHLDAEGVGALMRQAIANGRAANPSLHLGLCGEHGGDPASIRIAHDLGLDYVSCSAARIPVARIAAAHAALDVRGPQTSA